MNCKKPLRRWFLGYKFSKANPDKIVENGKVTPMHVLSPFNEDWDGYRNRWKVDRTKEITNQIINCGQCQQCRLERSRQWAVRCILESRKYEDNWFVTLTYDPEHVPLVIGEDDGWRMSLKPEHLTQFLKKLRRKLDYHENHEGIRFYAAGEYGENYYRPHYHLALFNLPLHDLRYIGLSETGYKTWQSKTISETWGYGRATVNLLSFDNAAYIARYIMKKQTGENAKIYEQMGIEPEFTRMSRDPGIAWEYYNQHKKEIYETDEMHVQTGKKLVTLHSLKYFDRLFDLEDPTRMKDIKEARRESAELIEMSKNAKTDVTPERRWEIATNRIEERIKKLPRSATEAQNERTASAEMEAIILTNRIREMQTQKAQK